jgi:hypothetical protein
MKAPQGRQIIAPQGRQIIAPQGLTGYTII